MHRAAYPGMLVRWRPLVNHSPKALLTRRLAEKKFAVSLTEAAKQFLIEAGYDPAFGARPLKRAIQRHIEDRLAMLILEGRFSEGDTITVDADPEKGELVFSAA